MTKSVLAAVLLAVVGFAPSTARADAVITAAGSTALEPLVKQSGRDYQKKVRRQAVILVSGGGSGKGIAAVAARRVTLGDSDIVAVGRPELIDHRVAVIGFAVIANARNGVTNLTKAQVRGVFSGAVTNWKQVGGKDEPVIVVSRPKGTGTRVVFTTIMMDGAALKESGHVAERTEGAVADVRARPGAVSFAALSGTRNQGVTLVSIDGVEPNDENIKSERYPIWSYEHIYTNGEPSREVRDFLSFITGNVELLHRLDYIGINEMKSSNIR